MKNRSGRPGGRGGWRALLDLRWIVYAVITAVAVFAFIVSYSHIYDLGREHAQAGTAARLLPLSVDLLIVAASLVLFIQYRENDAVQGLARWLPRLTLYAGIGATIAANVFYGLPHGWLAAVISGWPGVAFVAAVEVGMVIARPVPRSASVAASVPASLPSLREIQARRNCGQETARKILAELRAHERSRGGGAVQVIPPASGAVPAASLPAGADAPRSAAPAGAELHLNGSGRG